MRILVIFIFLVFGCAPKASDDQNTLAGISDSEVMKYAVAGKTLYENYCANCHQSDGSGLKNLIPPIKNSDYFKESVHRTVWIIKNGQEGEIEVNGKSFNQAMPANPKLTPLEISQIATYLYNIWGMEEGVIPSSEVEKFLREKPEL